MDGRDVPPALYEVEEQLEAGLLLRRPSLDGELRLRSAGCRVPPISLGASERGVSTGTAGKGRE